MELTITSGPEAGRTVQVTGDRLTVGRQAGNDLMLLDPKTSRQHAYFQALPDGRLALYDLGSSNGTFVNGHQVQSATLSGGEEVRFGDTTLRVDAASLAPSPPPPQPVVLTSPPQPDPAQVFPTQQVVPPRPPSPSTIQRLVIQRSLRRVTIIGIVAIVLLAVVAILLVTGVFENAGSKGLTTAQVVDRTRPSTVIVVSDMGGGSVGRGSGWVWDASRGLLVTNAHVVANGVRYTVSRGDKINLQVASDGSVTAGAAARDAQVVDAAPCEDMAVLKVRDTSGLSTIPRLPRQSDLKVGDGVVAVGYPATENLSPGGGFAEADLTGNTGVVSTVQTTFRSITDPAIGTFGPYRNVILTDTVINQGNSGGPLVDGDGRLVGMNSTTRSDVQGQNYAIGIDRINEIVPKLIANQTLC